MKKLFIFLFLVSFEILANPVVEMNAGEEIDVSINSLRVDRTFTANPNTGLCAGFYINPTGSWGCDIRNSYFEHGIQAVILDVNFAMWSNRFGRRGEMDYKDAKLTRCLQNPGTYTECNTHGNRIELYDSRLTGAWQEAYNAQGSVSRVKVITSPDTKAGVYHIPVSIAIIELGGWKSVANENIVVNVLSPTCTILDDKIDLGDVTPGRVYKKKINLNFSCDGLTNELKSFWYYSNPNSLNNTNLKNVFIKVIAPDGSERESGKMHRDIGELSNLNIQIDVKNNAEAGRLRVPLRFQLTYI
ncbi:hypothetical protein [Photobacterium leiognathi]|uniref:hypothetical protein n=1 Tax=Photobacterium leiognathi TaxID=553611 RepID=UPI002982958C|nr:hypothetical protein [Photobacterium leiognathi]